MAISAKWTLDMAAMQEDFFSDTALVGIVSALPAYRLCWMLQKHLDMAFVREPDLDISLLLDQEQPHIFPIYQYAAPLSGSRHLLYKLKSEKETLLPEVKQLDYLWMVQSNVPDADALQIAQQLKSIPDIQMAQILDAEKLKNRKHLLV